MKSRNQWCPICVNKTSKILYDWLSNQYKTEYEYVEKWCYNYISESYFRFDYYIEYNNQKILIELDGDQHFKNISNWTDYRMQQKIDIHKMNKALQNGFNIIRIYQIDVYCNLLEWKNIIEKIIFHIGNCVEKCKCEFENTVRYNNIYFISLKSIYNILYEYSDNCVHHLDPDIQNYTLEDLYYRFLPYRIKNNDLKNKYNIDKYNNETNLENDIEKYIETYY